MFLKSKAYQHPAVRATSSALLFCSICLAILLSPAVHAQRFVKVVNTIDDLVRLNPSDVYTNVFVADPLRGGLFTLAARTTTNRGTAFASTNATKQWNRQYEGDLNIQWFGATTGASDNTTAIQAAIDLDAGPVLIPEGEFIAGEIEPISGTVLRGNGTNSILKFLSGSSNLVQINFNNGGTTNESENTRGVLIKDLTIKGRVVEDGFSEQQHLIYANAVSDLTIENVSLIGQQGDAICIGGAVFGTSHITRRNRNIQLRNLLVDGLVRSNRNALSVISGEVSLNGAYIRRVGRSGMPGPIDFEPNWPGDEIINPAVRNVIIRECGGGYGVVVALDSAGTTNVYSGQTVFDNITLADDNDFTTGGGQIAFRTGLAITTNTAPMAIVIRNIHANAPSPAIPLQLRNVRGVLVDNFNARSGSVSLISDYTDSAVKVVDLTIHNSTFEDCGNVDGQLLIGSVDNFDILNSHFSEPILNAVSPIAFVGNGVVNVGTHIRMLDNRFIKGAAASMTKSVRVSNYTLTSGQNYFTRNVNDQTLANDFTYDNSYDLLSFDSNVFLRSDSDNNLDIRNGASGQTINLYNRYTDAANYERFYMRWNSDAAFLGTDKAGGGTARQLQIGGSGATLFFATSDAVQLALQSSGNLIPATDNTRKLGDSGNRWLGIDSMTLHLDGPLTNTVMTADRVAYWDTAKRLTNSANIAPAELEYLDGTTNNIQDQLNGKYQYTATYMIPIGQSATNGANKSFYIFPVDGTIRRVWANTFTVTSTTNVVVDINIAGSTIMSSSKIEIDVGEFWSGNATNQPVLTSSNFTAGQVITFDLDASDTDASGVQAVIEWYPR